MGTIPEDVTGKMPLISIGMPIYNGKKTLQAVLDSLLQQSLTDFEIVISDNGSTDGSMALCEAYAAKDRRIRYFRQSENIGATLNFKFVLDAARGRYFLWAASDDIRSADFLDENVRFLETHSEYVASTSPNCFEGQEDSHSHLVVFSLEENNPAERFKKFFRYCWSSHGIFYSVIRTEILRECTVLGKRFIASDWAIDLFLASKGKIYRCAKGLTVFGASGISNRPGSYRAFRNQSIEYIFPFYRLSRYVLYLSKNFPLNSRLKILGTLLSLNALAFIDQLHSSLYQFYCAHFKPKRKLPKLE